MIAEKFLKFLKFSKNSRTQMLKMDKRGIRRFLFFEDAISNLLYSKIRATLYQPNFDY